ncbi:MAG: ATP12 family protein [Alphaproteobacteria bacterium]
MKRFYKEATTATADGGGHTVLLDGRPVRTPKKAPLVLPTAALADAVAAEWAVQGEQIKPSDMHLLRLSNAAIDLIPAKREEVLAATAPYGETDLLYYRDEIGTELRAEQDAAWQPHLDWAAARYRIAFRIVDRLIAEPQPDGTAAALRRALEAGDDMALAGLSDLTAMFGSLVLTLAVWEAATDIDTAFAAARLDEAYQEQRWGIDAEAARRTERRLVEARAGARFLALLKG